MANGFRRRQDLNSKLGKSAKVSQYKTPSLASMLKEMERRKIAGLKMAQQAQNNQLNQLKGVGSMAASSYFSDLQDMINRSQLNQMQQVQWASNLAGPRRPQNTPMNPPKFLEGYKVTVRTGRTVWTVHHFEERQDPYSYGGSMVRLYYLEDNKTGKQTREVEGDLKIYEAEAVKPKATVDFDTVVISDEKRDQILEALEQINQSDLIFDTWGFGETIEKGKGVSMLFYGPPGTGKTLMAQAIANKLGKALKIISTADIESSAPGEAERNIRKHFKESSDGKSILLFDECDSLIYTRQNVGPIMSAQINELLSQIERFNGITLFTTNRLGTLDEAVNRRLALKLEFEMPSAEERAKIWQRMFPEKAPVDEKVNWERLAILEITGGYIKNSVLRAARMAAIEKVPDAEKKITMKHLVKAVRLETESMIEFENARAEHEGKVGRPIHGVTTGTGRGRTIEKVEGNIEKREADPVNG